MIQFNFNKLFTFKYWNAHATGFAQQITGSSEINLPDAGFRLDLFFQKPIFDKALLLKTGLDMGYYSRHKGLRYQPIVRQFYFENATTLGNYPMIDIYLSGEI
jgi:hypothetical protein